jgi:hypothetical protein
MLAPSSRVGYRGTRKYALIGRPLSPRNMREEEVALRSLRVTMLP